MALFSRRPPTRVPTLIEEIERPGLVPEVRLPVAPTHGQSRVDDPVTVAARVLHGLSFQGEGHLPDAPATPAQRPIPRAAEASGHLPPMPSSTWPQTVEQGRSADAVSTPVWPVHGGDGLAARMDTPVEWPAPETKPVTNGLTAADQSEVVAPSIEPFGAAVAAMPLESVVEGPRSRVDAVPPTIRLEPPAPPVVPDEPPPSNAPHPPAVNSTAPLQTETAPVAPVQEGTASSVHEPALTPPPVAPPEPLPAWMLQGRMVPPPTRMVLPVRVGGRPQGGVRTDLSMGSFGNPSTPLRSPAPVRPAENTPTLVPDPSRTQTMAASANAADTAVPPMPGSVLQNRLDAIPVPDTVGEVGTSSGAWPDEALAVGPVAIGVPDPLPSAPLPPPLATALPPVAVAPAVPAAPISPPRASQGADVPAVGDEFQRVLQQHIESWLQQHIPQLAQQWAAALAPELQRQMMVKMASVFMLQLGENPFEGGISHKKKVDQSPLT